MMAKRNEYWEKRLEADIKKMEKMVGKADKEEYRIISDLVKRIEGEINALYAEIQSKGIENVNRSVLYQLNHYNTLRNQIFGGYAELSKKEIKITSEVITGVVESQFANLSEGSLTRFSPSSVEKIVNSNWSGELFKTRIAENAAAEATVLANAIEDVIIAGKTPRQATLELQKAANITYNDAKRLVRTETQHAFNEANYEVFKEVGVEKVEIVDSGLENECSDCEDMAGVYPLAEAPIPPFHPNCACVLIPII